jgi:hypothetical protein
MNTYSNISSELRAFFSTNKIFKILLPIDMVLLFAGLAILFLFYVFRINFGDLISSLAYWVFLLGLLLTYANLKEQFLYIGLLGYAAILVINIIIGIFSYGHYFSFASLLAALVFGGLGYLVLKKTLSGSSSASVNG